MRLPRPYIPLSVRLKVAQRQAISARSDIPLTALMHCMEKPTVRRRLNSILFLLFPGKAGPPHLDYDPPLAVRKKIRDKNGVVIRYSPDANDPDFLVYRSAEDHQRQGLGLLAFHEATHTTHPKPQRPKRPMAGQAG